MLPKTKPSKFLLKKIITNFSACYHSTKKLINKTEYLSKEELENLQFAKLKNILWNAYENVHYYREVFDRSGFHPAKFNSLENLQKLPFLDKHIYKKEEIISKKYNKKLLPKAFTGGTTGEPLMLYRSFRDYGRERAYTEYAYRSVGMNHGVKTVYLRGPVDDKNHRYYKISDFGNTLYLSSHKMQDAQLDIYIELIRDFKPKLFYTLPSVCVVFADYLLRKSPPPLDSLKWIFCPSENLYDFQKEMIKKAFKCKIGTFYGHAEHTVFATKCDQSDMYHVLPQYGYCELIDVDGNPIREKGVMGEIVGTSFTNQASPLIRYKTGDFASYADKPCPCGRNYIMLEKIMGREQSLAVDRFNTKISVGPELLCTIHDKSYHAIKQFRIEQFETGILEISIETNENYNFETASNLFGNFFENIYPELFEIKFKKTSSVNKNKSSDKHIYFIQHMEQFKNSETDPIHQTAAEIN